MTIDCILSENSLDHAIKILENYRDSLEYKSERLVDEVSQVVENNARTELTRHIWSGETLATLHTEKMAEQGRTRSAKISVGGAAVWLEFGTGVVANNCAPGEFVHPMAKELGMYGIGEYGHGFGSRPDGWYFYDDGQYDAEWAGGTYNTYNTGKSIHTFGIPATLFMYHSAWAGRRALERIARGVFRD